jgi:hypothetical protein
MDEASIKSYYEGNVVNLAGHDGDNCNAAKYQEGILLHQLVVYVVAKRMAAGDAEYGPRGLLVWHSTGSGKTLTTCAIIEAFWDAKSVKRIIVSSLPDALRSNPPEKYYENMQRFFPSRFGKDIDVRKACSSRGVQFITFAQIAHLANLHRGSSKADDNFLSDTVLIMDESHNLYHPPPRQQADILALRDFLLKSNQKNATGLKVFLLTATPGSVPEDVTMLLNIIRNQNNPYIEVPNIEDSDSIKRFKDATRGMISFFDMTSDVTRFPRMMDLDYHRVDMSESQFRKYSEIMSKQVLPQHALKYSNMMFEWPSNMNIREFSAKLDVLTSIITNYSREKHYVYSAFHDRRGYGGQGILAIAKTLDNIYQYEQLDMKQAIEICKGLQEKLPLSELLSKKTRYVVAISSQLSKSRVANPSESKEIHRNLGCIVRLFNHPENAHGEYVHVFLASQGYNESVDLKSVRHVHIFEPLFTKDKDTQTIGRAVRFCSHAQLDRDAGEWLVQVHRYFSNTPLKTLQNKKMNIDASITDLQQRVEFLQYIAERDSEAAKDIIDYQSRIKVLEKQSSSIAKMAVMDVAVIDDDITQNAEQSAAKLEVMYDIIRANALDCRIFKDFHVTKYNVNCN